MPTTTSLSLRTVVDDVGPALRPYAGDVDVLDLHANDRGVDPDDLLPPLSGLLLPTSEGRTVIVGVCSCGEAGCGSLSMRVRRRGGTVLWEPADDAREETLERPFAFDLVQYLDELDRAAGDRPGEGRGRRVARSVRLLLRGYDELYGALVMFHERRVDWIGGWPWDTDVVRASVSGPGGQTVLEFAPYPRETDDHFARRIAADLTQRRMPAAAD